MKFVILLVASCVVVINGQFSKNLDNLNVDMILKNDRILTNYLKCLLDKGSKNVESKYYVNKTFKFLFKGPCTNEGRELKTTLPQVLKSGCNNCSEKERRNSRKVIQHLLDKKPQEWSKLEKKYDPTGEFTKEFRKSVQV